MYAFIDILKAAAAILITNSHYSSIWPISSLAFGGLLGDVMFFAASGFCLTGIRQRFPVWYLRRIIRIYPTLWIVTTAALIIGFLRIESAGDFVRYFIYPTYYHFIASIMLLYIVYYILIRLHQIRGIRIEFMMTAVCCVYLLCYIFLFDKSYYHIDVVEEYMVRFLFLEAMLLGALLREHLEQKHLRFFLRQRGQILLTMLMFVLYLMSKLLFSKIAEFAALQILNPLVLYLLLVSIMRLLCGWETEKAVSKNDEYEPKVQKTNVFERIVRGGIKLLSRCTLEIYLVQYLVYALVPDLRFPLNFLVVTGLILLCAWAANLAGSFLTDRLRSMLDRTAGKTGDRASV